jgi:hypothetical protein
MVRANSSGSLSAWPQAGEVYCLRETRVKPLEPRTVRGENLRNVRVPALGRQSTS